MYDYNRRTARTYDCRTQGVSTAWIDERGTIHLLKGGQGHDSWAQNYIGDSWDWDSNMKLLEKGFIRVTNLLVWQMIRPTIAAKQAAVEWMIHCATRNNLDLEKPTIMIEGRSGDMDVYSPADFVKRLGGRRAEDKLFTVYYETWPLPKAASYNYDRRTARTILALKQKALLGLLGKGGTFGVLSGYRPGSKHQNKLRHGELLADLQRLGYRQWNDIRSKWEGVPEKSLLVPGIQPKHLFDLMRKYNQDAVIYKSRDGVIGLYYQAGYAEVAVDPTGDPAFELGMGEDLYSKVRHDWSFEFGFVWGKHIPYDGSNPVSRQEAKAAVLSAAA